MFFFDEDKAISPLERNEASTGNRTDFEENISASWGAASSSDRMDSERNNLYNHYGVMINFLNQNGLTGFENPILDFDDVTLKTDKENIEVVGYRRAEPMRDSRSLEPNFWSSFEQLDIENKNPEFYKELVSNGYDSKESMQKKIGVESQEKWQKYHDVSSRSSGSWYWGGGAGSWLGMMGSLATDVPALATIPISGFYGTGAKVTTAMWKVARVEALIAATAEIPIQMKVQSYRKELGLESGIGLAIKNIAAVGVFSGAFAGLLTGAIKGTPLAYGKARAELSRLSDKEIDKLNTVLNIKETDIEKPAKEPQPYEDTKDGIVTSENRFNGAVTSIITDTKFDPPKTELKLNLESLDEIPTRDIRLKPNDIEFDPDNFQYKVKDVGKKGISSKLSEVKVWDNDSAGVVLVYEFKPKTKFEVNDVINIDANGTKATINKKFFINNATSKNIDDLDKYSIQLSNGKKGTITLTKLKEFNKGKKAIIDGHQRLGLAQRLQVDQFGKPIVLNSRIFREVDGIEPSQAKFKGLLVNLRAGTGSAIDAAKILRSEYKLDWENIKLSLSPRAKLVREVEGLKNLSDDAYGMIYNNQHKYSVDLAAKIGSNINDKSIHAAALKSLSDNKPGSAAELDFTLAQLNNPSNIVKMKQQSLLGEDSFANTLINERSALLNWAIKNAKLRSHIFNTIVDNDKTLQKAGNKLNTINNLDEATKNDILYENLKRVAIHEGELADRLTEAAKLWSKGDRTGAKELFMDAIEGAAARGDFSSNSISRRTGTDKIENETSELAETSKYEEDLKSEKLFIEPAGAAVKDQADDLAVELMGEEIPSSISRDAEAGLAERTSSTEKSPPVIQELSAPLQKTTSDPPPSEFASAMISPPKYFGSTSSTNVIGNKSVINKKLIVQRLNNYEDIHSIVTKKKQGFEEFLEELSLGKQTLIDVRTKDITKIASKMKDKGASAEQISDYLGGRIHFESLKDAKEFLEKLQKTSKLLEVDDFMVNKPVKRGSGYRAIHTQIMTRDGFSVELQIRINALERASKGSYKAYAKWRRRKNLSQTENAQMKAEVGFWEKELDNDWFNYKDKEFGIDLMAKEIKKVEELTTNIKRLEKRKTLDPETTKSLKILKDRLKEVEESNAILAKENEVGANERIATGERIDENGERLPTFDEGKDILQDNADRNIMLKRLKDCF